MATQIFVNLPVSDLATSKAFYQALGYITNPQFEDENATNVVISDTIFLMLLVKPFFGTFTSKDIVDASAGTEAIVALSAESREAVDELVDKAFAAGAGKSKDPMDEGFMHSRSFADPDGHLFEVMWMDQSAIQRTE